MTEHGPGVEWLAQRAGVEPAVLLKDRAALLSALSGAGRDAASLTARLASEDNATRRRAEVEARAVRARLASPDGRTAGQRFSTTVAQKLRAEAARQRDKQR